MSKWGTGLAAPLRTVAPCCARCAKLRHVAQYDTGQNRQS